MVESQDCLTDLLIMRKINRWFPEKTSTYRRLLGRSSVLGRKPLIELQMSTGSKRITGFVGELITRNKSEIST